jgi:hypothetical protein
LEQLGDALRAGSLDAGWPMHPEGDLQAIYEQACALAVDEAQDLPNASSSYNFTKVEVRDRLESLRVFGERLQLNQDKNLRLLCDELDKALEQLPPTTLMLGLGGRLHLDGCPPAWLARILEKLDEEEEQPATEKTEAGPDLSPPSLATLAQKTFASFQEWCESLLAAPVFQFGADVPIPKHSVPLVLNGVPSGSVRLTGNPILDRCGDLVLNVHEGDLEEDDEIIAILTVPGLGEIEVEMGIDSSEQETIHLSGETHFGDQGANVPVPSESISLKVSRRR